MYVMRQNILCFFFLLHSVFLFAFFFEGQNKREGEREYSYVDENMRGIQQNILHKKNLMKGERQKKQEFYTFKNNYDYKM